MTVEMEVDNQQLDIVPGMYATVMLKVDERPHAIAGAYRGRALGWARACTSWIRRHRIQERAIEVGLETPTKYEVLSG